MTIDTKEKQRDKKEDRRKGDRPRRRLVDLTLEPGTNKREDRDDRRKESAGEAMEEPSDTETR
jgi:hypothetical protein